MISSACLREFSNNILCSVQQQHTLFSSATTYFVQFSNNILCSVQQQHTLFSSATTYFVQFSNNILSPLDFSISYAVFRSLSQDANDCFENFSSIFGSGRHLEAKQSGV